MDVISKGFGLWQNVTEEEVKMAVRQVERKVVGSLYDL